MNNLLLYIVYAAPLGLFSGVWLSDSLGSALILASIAYATIALFHLGIISDKNL